MNDYVKIFILDDSKTSLEYNEKIVNLIRFSEKLEKNVKIEFKTGNPKELYKKLESLNDINNHLYFLDIDLDGMVENGIDVATNIRNFDMYGNIVFVTSHPEFMKETYERRVKALDYIQKDSPDMKERFKQAIIDSYGILQLGINNKGSNLEFIQVKSGSSIKNIIVKNILMIEVENRKTVIFYENEKGTGYQKCELYENISFFEKELLKKKQCNIVNIHKSRLVNSNYIIETNNKTVTLKYGLTGEIARGKNILIKNKIGKK